MYCKFAKSRTPLCAEIAGKSQMGSSGSKTDQLEIEDSGATQQNLQIQARYKWNYLFPPFFLFDFAEEALVDALRVHLSRLIAYAESADLYLQREVAEKLANEAVKRACNTKLAVEIEIEI
jgi:hypothetical protein